jgi:hypothetical protein
MVPVSFVSSQYSQVKEPSNMKNYGHSADVRMHLTVNGQVLSIGQLGPDFLILRDPTDHPFQG